MSLKKLSEATKSEARKAGKLPKAPKKPKQSASLSALNNYVTRQRGNTAGMEAVPGQNNFPYGWPSLRQFVETTGIAKPSDFYTYVMTENVTGIDKRFIHFPDPYTFILFFAWFIQNVRGGKIEYWYSLNENSAARYRQTMNTVIPRILNELT